LGNATPPWRHLEVDVLPEEARVSWEGKPIGGERFQHLTTIARRLSKNAINTQTLFDLGASTVGLSGAPNGPGPLLAVSALVPGRTNLLKSRPIEFSSRGSLGLYVRNGRAEFRRVVVEPLP
jgi:hypothetical protein